MKYLFIALVIGVLVRFIYPAVPPSINWDEASLGYNAYSILKTGKDEWGRFLPISFEAFGDYKLPIYIYTDTPFIRLMGLTEQAVRLPSQLAGIFSILVLYLIMECLINKDIAAASASLLAISPWNIFLSRIAVEANVSFFFFLGGLYFFLRGLKKSIWLLFASVFFGLTLFTYNSARVFVPLFLMALVFFHRKELAKTKWVIPLMIVILFLAVAFYQAVFVDSNSRYFWVAIVDQGAINFLDQARGVSTLPTLLTDLIYNRYIYLFVNIIKNYISHFSPDFLFINGGSNYQFSLPGHGLMYIFELPFVVLGLITLRKYPQKKVIWSWLLLAPIPASITRESPHALRSIYMLGSLQVITALGVVESIKLLKIFPRKLAVILIGAIYVVGCMNFLGTYFNEYPKKYSPAWQYGMKQTIDAIKNQSGKVFLTKKYGEPHIFYLFFTQYDPVVYQSNPTLIRYSRSNWKWVDRLDNIYFINDWEIKDRLSNEHNALLVTSPGNYPPQFKLEKTIYFLDGSPAFDILAAK